MAELRAAIGKMRLGRATGLLASLVVAAALVATGCGSSSNSSGGGGSSSSSSGSGSSAGKTNIGLILAGPKDDQSSNQDAYERVSSVAKDAGVKLSVSESVPPSNAPQIVRSLAQQGYGIIGANGAEFQKPIEQIAPQFPKTRFIVLYGAPTKVPNVLSVTFDPFSTTYVDGVAAGAMTKTGKIGIISGEDSQVFDQLVSGVKQGVKSVNPSATVKVVFSGDYSDAQKNKEASQTLIDNGADVLMGYLDAGIVVMARTAQSDGKYVVGIVENINSLAPKAVITSVDSGVGQILADAIKKAEQGDFKGGQQELLGLKQGYGSVEAFGSFVPQAVRKKVLDAAKGIKSGSIQVNSN
jgi:basic membrane lipoprotein Med (substrate-binding protein (PBP1-ABC) superfamily)